MPKPKVAEKMVPNREEFAASKHLNGKQEFIYHAKKQYYRYIP
jgi:hypothetical protein